MQHMMVRRLILAATGAFLTAAAISPAAARTAPAPVSFGPAPVETAALAAAGPGEYGYGRNARSARAAMDLRARVAPQATPQPRARPEWLETERVGAPYEAKGRWYVPAAEPGYAETGLASWYGPDFDAKPTATGDVFDQDALSAAHPTLPIPSLVQVTNLANGRELIVRVNDRGPFKDGRIIDLSRRAADVLGFVDAGEATVHVRYLGPAPKRPELAGKPPARPLLSTAPAPERKVAAQPAAAPAATEPSLGDVTGPRVPHDREGAFVVQIGAFSALSNAQKVREAVAGAGSASVETRAGAGGAVHRVRLGPFSDRAVADAARVQIAALGFAGAIVARAD
jgi:rare lipoprotein A